ncbi:MAG: hypothetical protein JWO67_4856 [Streptosporangiaceae bacterium]|nr:hypothetical protein [Streptosporangiaceae bacterium]
MAKYEVNGDLWWYGDNEYHRGDAVDVDTDQQFIKNHIKSGFLVEVGHHEKLAKAEQKAVEDQAKADAEQVKRDDAEAHRRVTEAEARTAGTPNVSSQDGPKTTRRTSGK